MNCDICGRQIHGKPNRIVVEGARMTACESCARLGTPYREPKVTFATTPIATARPKPSILPRPVPPRPTDRRVPKEVDELDLADNYPQIIQKARRKHELSQEELAMKLKERLSIIQKIELGKMVPDIRLARTLEHVLRVKLLMPRSEPPAPKLLASATKQMTLADVARIRKKEGKEVRELEVEG
ncbi:multiprotein bridging factor aMBF1 [[Eubacterium] cellulosolvens]